MMKAKIIVVFWTLILLSACLSNQFTDKQSATNELEISTPSKVVSSEMPTMGTSTEINQCIFPPVKDSLLLQSVYQIGLAKHGINMKSISEPVLSPNNQYLALSLYEVNGGNRLSHLAVLNIKRKYNNMAF